jgi:very-short-patch-repair endonuclease
MHITVAGRDARSREGVQAHSASHHEVDFLWPAHGLIVEVDGYAFHSSRSAFERDRRRDAELQTSGYRVIRITWRQIADEPEAVIATLAAALAAQERRPSALARSSTVSA